MVPLSRKRRWLAILASTIGALVMLGAQQAGQLRLGRNPLTHLRTEFWHDQLGYLAISANVARGHFDLTEPVTMTGVNHYPRFYYSVVGLVARVFDMPTVVSWNLVSFVLQLAAAFTVGVVAAHLSRRWWVGFLAPAPFFTGVFAFMGQAGRWYTHLDAHAVLWGPYGVLFSNNAETAGLCVGIISLGGLIWAWTAKVTRATRITVTLLASAAVGALSSFQTYSFLTLTYLLVYGAAVAGITLARRRGLAIVITIALLAGVFLAGPLLADRLGQLPTLMFGLVPATPGLIVAIIRSRGAIALAGMAAVAAAAPQVGYTLIGMIQGDPFLTYRVASNHQLGVVSWPALWGASVVLVGLVVAAGVGWRMRDRVTVTIAVSALVSLPLLAVNDMWGANAEPYRFWIEGMLLGGVLSMLALARLVGVVFVVPKTSKESEQEGDVGPKMPARLLAVGLVVVGVIWCASLPDWANSLRDASMQAAWDPFTERETAIANLASSLEADAQAGLLTTELCIDNRTAKANSGVPVSNYHLGMAWPSHRDAIDAVIAARNIGELDFDAMTDSDTRWILTDSNCNSDWESVYRDRLTEVSAQAYQLQPGEVISEGSQNPGTITLWAVRSQ